MLTDIRARRIIAHMAVQAGGGGFIDEENFALPKAHWLTKVEPAREEIRSIPEGEKFTREDLIRLYMGCVN